ncbi:MAG: ferrous iron transport protein B [Alistipes sp.]
MRLSELKTGETATIVKVLGHGGFRRRIMEMGFVRGSKVGVELNAPLKDPIEYRIMDYAVSLRRAEAEMVVVISDAEAAEVIKREDVTVSPNAEDVENVVAKTTHRINVALVGNPNSGKTSLFNRLSGAREHVGNYSGVTVDAKSGKCTYKDYELQITDLPGTYALSPYSPEELYVRKHLAEEMPDVVLNVVVASNIERNLYLTTELIDMSQRMVVALNMYDELAASGATLDYELLGSMMGVPMIPVVGKTGHGIEQLLDTIIAVYENRDERVRHIHINQGIVEESVQRLNAELKAHRDELPKCFPPRYYAMRLLEGDKEIGAMLAKRCPHYPEWAKLCEREQTHIRLDLGEEEDIETAFANQKYGFISGALRETFTPGRTGKSDITKHIDEIVTHRILGYPVFFAIMWLMFYCTFSLGQYPQEWIGSLVGFVGRMVQHIMPDGALKDMIAEGIIGGVGSVIVFLPNIMILYLFIAFMEDSGYLARAAFIMDKVMHKIGLHGKSFIPLIMGFGCNVPAVMATRTIESRSSRLITMLIIPFTSCSARLPIYILFIGTFLPAHSGSIMFGLYMLGIALAVLTARLVRSRMFKVDETPFVMELPPYRLPTMNATLSHMWEKCAQYLRKMGGLILVASIVVWFLSYYPRQAEGESTETHYANSYIGRIGRFCEPVFAPLGLDWKASVSVVSGVAAKEIMVSTIGVLYAEGGEEEATDEKPADLPERLAASGDFDTASVLALLVFTLLYFPCLATISAIASEGGWRWATASALYNTAVAWMCAFAVYHLVHLLGL